MRRVAALLLGAVVPGLFLGAAAGAALSTPPEHRRGEDQTYLTFPEWFLVHSPAEYADFLKRDDPHHFPLLSHVGQLWSSYSSVIDATRKYPFNGEYHVMIAVIAISTTVEYGLKSLYEGTFGRLAAAARGDRRTPEDEFAAATAQRYVDFIRDRPWYEFPFMQELYVLWQDVPLAGGSVLRKLERRFALSSELLVKSGYGWLIERATRSSFEAPKAVTTVIIDREPLPVREAPEVRVLAVGDNGRTLLALPRYERFTPHAQELARQGARFEEIAGNRGLIVVSVLTNESRAPGWANRTLIQQPYLTRPGWRRLVVEVPIARLHEAVLAASPTLEIEHVYDF